MSFLFLKKASCKAPGNYRPVSLTSVVVKLFESVIRDVIMEHLLHNHLISNQQHGFITKRSCMTQLLSVMDDWTNALEDGYSVDVLYLDYRKAIDSVPHGRLVIKLRAYGIQGKLLSWIELYLSDQQQQVVVLNSCKSSWSRVLSGIPQGSVLGPLLYVIYVNDLPVHVNNPIQLFADDTKVYARSSCQYR